MQKKTNNNNLDLVITKYGNYRFKNIPSEEFLKKYYEKIFYKRNVFNNSSIKLKLRQRKFNIIQYKKIIDNFIKLRGKIKNKKVLEIGCGYGDLLQYLKNKGMKTYGLEPNPNAVKYCQKNKLLVKKMFVTDFDEFKNIKFDFIILDHTLEHIIDPVSLIKKIKNLLKKKNGILFVNVPNDFSPFQIAASKLKEIKKQWWISFPLHISYFSHSSLKKLLESCGFEVLKQDTDFPMELFLLLGNNYIKSRKIGRLCQIKRENFEEAFIKNKNKILLEKLYECFLTNNLGRSAAAYARIKKN